MPQQEGSKHILGELFKALCIQSSTGTTLFQLGCVNSSFSKQVSKSLQIGQENMPWVEYKLATVEKYSVSQSLPETDLND